MFLVFWGMIGCLINIFWFKLKFLFVGGDELELFGCKDNYFFRCEYVVL